MNKKQFADLLAGVQQMGQHLHGKAVPGVRVRKVADIQARKIRQAAGLSQSEFAQLIGVPVKTLQNWEQNRTRPAGTARALLKVVQSNPRAAIKALHAS
jgi:putative transcriptional regulator